MKHVKCDEIKISERFRKDFGDLKKLADSIGSIGQLQPIGITPQKELIFGERRLRAIQDVLKWPTIYAVEISLESIILGEYAENEVRKDFTASERIAIGKAVEEFLGNRAGRPKKEEPAPTLFEEPKQKIVENFPQFQSGDKTRDVAAKAAGFGNAKTYEQAKTVVESGVPELVDAMDKGEVSISAAAAVAKLPEPEQREVIEQGPGAVKDKAKEMRDHLRQKVADKKQKPVETVTEAEMTAELWKQAGDETKNDPAVSMLKFLNQSRDIILAFERRGGADNVIPDLTIDERQAFDRALREIIQPLTEIQRKFALSCGYLYEESSDACGDDFEFGSQGFNH